MSPCNRRRQHSPAFCLPKGTGWIIFAIVMGALYFFKHESFWGIVGVLALPFTVFLMIRGAKMSPKKRDWHPSGQSDEDWERDNNLRS